MSDEEYYLGKQLAYKDVMLEPQYSLCRSRGEIDLTTTLGKWKFKNPVIPANMKTVMNEELAHELAMRGYFYVMHRFNVDIFAFVTDMKNKGLMTSISVGVNDVDKELVHKLYLAGLMPDFITIDIAHGYSEHMVEMIKYITDRTTHGEDTFIIAGNVCSVAAVKYLADKGADCVKVGVGPGHACTTKLMTGFFRPQFTAVAECCDERWAPAGIPIIADGGVEHNGDIAKALVAGATMVMAGHLFAGHDESPGDRIQTQDGWVMEYYGSASEHNKGFKKHVEGRRLYIPCRGSIWGTYEAINDSLRSSCSYAGARNPAGLKGTPWREI